MARPLRKKDPWWLTVLIYAILIVFTVIAVYPILRVISISLRPGNLLHSTSLRLIPKNATLESYRVLFLEKPFLRWLLNSTVVSGMVTILGVSLASTAGYAFSRFNFKLKEAGMISVIMTQMFPVTMLLIPLFVMLIHCTCTTHFWGS